MANAILPYESVDKLKIRLDSLGSGHYVCRAGHTLINGRANALLPIGSNIFIEPKANL